MIKETENRKLKEAIRAKLAKDPHCPCQIDKTDDTICPCKDFRESKAPYTCHCGLYTKTEDEDFSITQYEMKKQIIKQTPPLKITESVLNLLNGTELLTDNKKLCLMCRELYDFTVIENIEGNGLKLLNLIEEVLKSRGEIHDVTIEPQELALSFWIVIKEEVFCYKLFTCDSMVINLKEN